MVWKWCCLVCMILLRNSASQMEGACSPTYFILLFCRVRLLFNEALQTFEHAWPSQLFSLVGFLSGTVSMVGDSKLLFVAASPVLPRFAMMAKHISNDAKPITGNCITQTLQPNLYRHGLLTDQTMLLAIPLKCPIEDYSQRNILLLEYKKPWS